MRQRRGNGRSPSYGINTNSLKKLQIVQNSGLRLVYKLQRYDRQPINAQYI